MAEPLLHAPLIVSYLETARHQWAEGDRRVSATAADPTAYEALMAQVEAVSEALRKRIGEHFTLFELAELYGGDDGWAYEAVAARGAGPGWVSKVSIAQDAAFHRYARAASDYSP